MSTAESTLHSLGITIQLQIPLTNLNFGHVWKQGKCWIKTQNQERVQWWCENSHW